MAPAVYLPMGDKLGSEGIVWIQDGKCWAYLTDNWNDGLYPFAVSRHERPM